MKSRTAWCGKKLNRTSLLRVLCGGAALLRCPPGLPAQSAPDVTTETLCAGLDKPCGVAVQPGTGHVFVSDSGAGRVVRVDPDRPGAVVPAVVGFPVAEAGGKPQRQVGPLGLAFLDRRTLVVGQSRLDGRGGQIRIYDLPASGQALAADQSQYKLVPGPQADPGSGYFYGLVSTGDAIYATCSGADTTGWVAKAEVQNRRPHNLERFPAATPGGPTGTPVGITVNYRGHVVVSQVGAAGQEKDSLLTFYHAQNGRVLMQQKTGLDDVVGLAYSRNDRTGRLYAVDAAWSNPKEGGLYRLDSVSQQDGTLVLKAVRILPVDRPSALAFDPDGVLYLTLFGPADENAAQKPGQLLKITGNL